MKNQKELKESKRNYKKSIDLYNHFIWYFANYK